MLARLFAFLIWALVAGTAVFWGLRLWVKAPSAPAGTASVESSAAARGDVTRLLGAAPVQVVDVAAPPPESSRFKLSGLMSPRQSDGFGVALIAVDGKPARAFKVGARLDGQMTLQSVSLRSATVGAAGGAPAFTLELPLLPQVTTGTLVPAVNVNLNAPGSFVPPQMQQQQQLQQQQLQQQQQQQQLQQAQPPLPGQAVVQQLSSDQLAPETEQIVRPAPGRNFTNQPAAQR